MKTIGKRAERFLRNQFKGNGKYHIRYSDGRRWCSTYFQIFTGNTPGMIKIIKEGNDAPRGGKVGDFVEVEFTDEFYNKYTNWIGVNLPEKRKFLIAYMREENIDKILNSK